VVNTESTVVAGNGTIVEAGGVYLTFSGDPATPYIVAKVISIGGGPGWVAPYQRISPGQPLEASPDLWVKLFYANYADPTDAYQPAAWAGPSRVIPVTVDVFLAWGPPKFPIRVGTEPVTTAELAARVEDWYKEAEPPSGLRLLSDISSPGR
jgi:hypothetical protein